MTLSIQIYSLLFSFFFGVLFSFALKINYHFIYHSNLIIQILFTLAFVLLLTILYFIGLEKINYGILHSYYFIMIILGFLLEHTIEKIIKK